MTLSKSALRALLWLGVALLAHSLVTALGMRSQLQAHHHASEADDDGLLGGASSAGPTNAAAISAAPAVAHALPAYLVAEVLLGLALAIVGHAGRQGLTVIARREIALRYRYDRVCGIDHDFIHFRHRAAAAGSSSGRSQASSGAVAAAASPLSNEGPNH